MPCRLLIPVLAALVAAGAAAPAHAAAPKVKQLVVFRSGEAVQKTTSTRLATVVARGRRCAAGNGTALAALVRSRNFWGAQFHPERSGAAGARVLANFLRLK